LSKQTLRQGGRLNVRYLLMFGEGANFGLGQAAERNTVLQRNHGVFLPGNARLSPRSAFSGWSNVVRGSIASYFIAVHCIINAAGHLRA
jgi:hypothetical protein